MAVRLKYAGIPAEQIVTVHDYSSLLDKLLSMVEEGQNVYLLPTYTAMLDMRKLLRKRYHLKNFWE